MRVVCAGEVMIELAPAGADGLYRRGVAGDSYNTAVHLARAGLEVGYLTRLGDDPLSDDILTSLRAEGIDTALVQRCAGRRPGLYLIDNDASGERRFSYWRGESPARELFGDLPPLPAADIFYFTGITLAVTRAHLQRLLGLLEELASGGARVVFDTNFRPQLWRDREQARQHYAAVLPWCDTLLATLDDEQALWDVDSVDSCRALYTGHGIRELVVREPDLTAHAFAGDDTATRCAPAVEAIDTTGAGDSFNAAYLAARAGGTGLDAALETAQALAAGTVQHRGAIAPRD